MTTVINGDIALPVTSSGKGQQLILVNGAGATQFAWRKVVPLLKDRYDVITFDFRGHGDASPAADYSIEAFLSDFETVIDSKAVDSKPIAVAWSLGADITLSYAAKNPDKLAGLVVVDGAMPISLPLVEDEEEMRRKMDGVAMKVAMFLVRLSSDRRYQMPGGAMADLVVALDPIRQKYIDIYTNLDLPITAVVARKYDGRSNSHTKRNKKIWAEAASRLQQARPDIAIHWIDDTHASLPLKHAGELVEIIDEFASKLN
jgi:pimeloyl-ACP methyl ester carboxylesterase